MTASRSRAAPCEGQFTSRDISDALDAWYRHQTTGDRVVTFRELRIGTGYGKDAESRIDYFVFDLMPSRGLLRLAFEIKVSRGDFLKELKNPQKRRPALLLSNEYAFVAPQGMIRPDELPPECGLAEVDAAGECWWTVRAPYRDTPPPPWRFMAAIARRAQQCRVSAEAFRDESDYLREQLRALGALE